TTSERIQQITVTSCAAHRLRADSPHSATDTITANIGNIRLVTFPDRCHDTINLSLDQSSDPGGPHNLGTRTGPGLLPHHLHPTTLRRFTVPPGFQPNGLAVNI